jgi:hypothetical protein
MPSCDGGFTNSFADYHPVLAIFQQGIVFRAFKVRDQTPLKRLKAKHNHGGQVTPLHCVFKAV